MIIRDFEPKYTEEAAEIALRAYNHERAFAQELPEISDIPILKQLSGNGFGVAAFEGGKMVGFLCSVEPFENAFRSTDVRGVFSPMGANGAVMENHGRIYIKFNISHSGTKVMCAVSDHDIGCDVEQIVDIDMEIAKRFFFAEEYEALMKCTCRESRNDLFFRYWTLKESFMKATGLGFELALDSFCIMLDSADISVRQNVDGRR